MGSSFCSSVRDALFCFGHKRHHPSIYGSFTFIARNQRNTSTNSLRERKTENISELTTLHQTSFQHHSSLLSLVTSSGANINHPTKSMRANLTKALKPFSVSTWRLPCTRGQKHKEMYFPSLVWQQYSGSTTSSSTGIKWSSDCTPGLISKHRGWTFHMLLWLLRKSLHQDPET